MAKNGRSDSIDTEQIRRNIRVTQDSTQSSPFNEEIMAGSADYGEALYNNLPIDNVGFMPKGGK
jgi:hypothetical protein